MSNDILIDAYKNMRGLIKSTPANKEKTINEFIDLVDKISNKKDATIISIIDFSTSGSKMKCLCCDNEFHWSQGNINYGICTIKHTRQNSVLIPIEYFVKILRVDVDKYLQF